MKITNYWKFIGKKNPLLLKMMLSYILTGAVLLCTYSLLLTPIVLNEHENKVIDMSDKYLLQMKNTASLLLSEVDNYYYNKLYLNDSTIYNALYGASYTWQEIRDITNKLNDMAQSSPIVDSIYIYNAAADTVFTNNLGVSNIHDFFDSEIIDTIGSLRTIKDQPYLQPRKVLVPSSGEQNENHLLTTVYCEPSGLKAPDCAMVININQKKFQQLINDSSLSSGNIKSFIVNSDGTLLTADSQHSFMSNIADEDYFNTVITNDKTHEKIKDNSETMLLSYEKSDEFDIYFICLNPYSTLKGYGTPLFRSILFLTLLFILSAALIALVFAFLFYKPIRSIADNIRAYNNDKNSIHENELRYLEHSFHKLTNNIDRLQSDVDSYVDINRTTILNRIIHGEYSNKDGLKADIKKYELNLDYFYFRTVLFSIDSFSKVSDTWKNDLELLKFGIRNIISEIMEEAFNIEAVSCDNDNICVIIGYKTMPDSKESIYQFVKDVQENVEHYLKITLTVTIGSIVKTQNNIKYSYQNALQAAQYRLLYGQNSIIDFDEIDDVETDEYEYPFDIEDMIIKNLRLENAGKAKAALETFINKIKHFNYSEINLSLNQLLVSTFNAIHSMALTDIDNVHSLNNKDLLTQLNGYDTLEEISCFFSSLFDDVVAVKAKKKENKNSAVINKLIETINEQYSDPGLCIETLANEVSLSPNYLRSIFKMATNQSLSKYIMAIRIEKAKDLLVNSDITIAEIAEATGFSTRGYFCTVFKKYMSETPAEYRKKASITEKIFST